MQTRSSKNIKMKKVKRKRLNISRLLVFVLFIYLIVCLVLYILKEPVRHYEISGNNFITDMEIIRYLNLEKYPSYISLNKKKLEKKLKNMEMIEDVKISYSLDFTLKIEVNENEPMFILKNTNEIVLEDGRKIPYNEKYVGIPLLLNNTPEEIMRTLAKNLSKIDFGIRYLINDIEYNPSTNKNNQIIDEYRFLLSMNDKNLVFINAKNLKNLNKYLDIIATHKITTNGTLYLDGNVGNSVFKVNDSSISNTQQEEKQNEN